MQTIKYKQWIQILKSAFFFSPHLQWCAFPCPHLPTLSSLPSTWSTRSASCQAPWPPLTLTSLSKSSAPGIQVFIAIEYWIFIQTRFRPTRQQFRARDTVKLVTRILWQSILQGLRCFIMFLDWGGWEMLSAHVQQPSCTSIVAESSFRNIRIYVSAPLAQLSSS